MFTSRRIATMGGDKFRDEFSLAFDGGDDYIDLGSQAGDLRLSGSNGAIVTWIKPVSGGDTYQRIVDKSDGATAQNGYSFILHTDAYIQGDIDGNSGITHSNTALTYGVWSHCVWTWDGSNHYIYINGKLDDTASSSLTPPSDTTNMRIGSWNHSTAREFEGNISEVAIYNTGLTASQVKTIYNDREPYNHKEGVASGNLKAWYRMGDGIFDQKAVDDAEGGIVTDMVTPTLGADVLGGEGNFSDPSYWTITASESVVESGVAKWLGNGSYGQVRRNGVLTSGQIYRIDLDVNAHNGAADHGIALNFSDPYIRLHTGSQTGHFFVYFRAEGTDLILYQAADYDVVAEIDNVVVRPVNGNAGAMYNFSDTTSFTGDTP